MNIVMGTNVSRYGNARERFVGISLLVIAVLVLMLVSVIETGAAEKTTDQLLEEARAAVKGVSVQEVKDIVDGKEKAVLLDIRDTKQYRIEHIQGAKGMSGAVGLSARILEHHLKKIVPDKTAKIVVYCEFETRSPLAVKEMNGIGYSNAVYMRGGMEAWKKSGYPLEKE